MKPHRGLRLAILFVLAALILLASGGAAVANGQRIVQDDPGNPTKFSIDGAIANGSTSTSELYIGTVASYLGDKADGKTPVFKGGFGVHPNDILLMNDRVGIVLAVGTPDPWGYPGGSILDAGRVIDIPSGSTDLTDAILGEDTVLTVQFLFNEWDEWAPVNSGMIYYDLVNYNFVTKQLDSTHGIPAVQVTRKYLVPYTPPGGVPTPRDLDIVSYYSIAPGKDFAYMIDTITNNGGAFSTFCNNEVSLSNKGGDGIDTKTVQPLAAANAYNWIEGPNGEPSRQFSTTLICPGDNPGSDGRIHPFATFRGATGYRELRFSDLSYVENETRFYESYLMIDDECSWQKVYDFWADFKNINTFLVSGSVTDTNGDSVPYPVVMIYRNGALYGWVMGDAEGEYQMRLPDEGDIHQYQLKVAKSGTVESDLSDEFTSATVPSAGIDLTVGDDLVPVTFHFQDQDGRPVWGRVSVGTIPTISFTGKNYFFCDNAADGSVTKGDVTTLVAPGDYSATCSGEGFGFYSYTSASNVFNQVVTGNTSTGTNRTVTIQKPISAPTDWFGIDNHHHGWRADAFSPPEDVAKAQITAGLEVLTLDDHEHTVDNIHVYNWARKMDATGYMPSEEITASWAHFDAVPLTEYAYERWLDRDQKNEIVNTNLPLQGIIDDAHNAGLACGANHPNHSYGLFLADDHDTVPGGMSDDFDGIEAQFNKQTLDEAMNYWNAYVADGSYRGCEVKRPHYIYASTDIHECGRGTGSGARRSYVYVKDGATKSARDFESFSLEFARNNAAGHSFNSSGVFITPTNGKVYGNTYRTDAEGNLTATFEVTSLNNVTDVYVFGSTGTKTGTGYFNIANHLVSQTTYTDSSTTRNFTLNLRGVEGRQWYAIAAASSAGRYAFTNPIWVNGPDVPLTRNITSVHSVITEPEILSDGGLMEQPPTAVLSTTPWTGFLLADWESMGNSGSGVYSLSFTAPEGYVFDSSLADPRKGVSVTSDGVVSRLTYMADSRGPSAAIGGVPGGWVRGPVSLVFSADDGVGSGVDFIEYKIDSGDWTKGTEILISKSGTTVIACRATDMMGNVGSVVTRTVKIDRVKPEVATPKQAKAKRGGQALLRYRVTDTKPNSGKAKVVIRIKDRNGKGKLVKTLNLGQRPVKLALQTAKFKVPMRWQRGTYRFFVYATDLAGNKQVKIASNKLVVR